MTSAELIRWLEIAATPLLPLLAVLIGDILNHRIDRIPNTTWRARFVDFVAPLLSPLIALLFVGSFYGVLNVMGLASPLLPFVLKILLDWLAIRFVTLTGLRGMSGTFILALIVGITILQLFGLWAPLTAGLMEVRFAIGSAKFNLYLVLKTAIALVVLFWAAGFAVDIMDNRLRRARRLRASNRALILKMFQIVLYFIVFLVGLQLIGLDITALSVFGGALGVGIGFGLQKIASNFMSGIILLFEKSVEVDDLVRLQDGTQGFIRHTGARFTLLEQADGTEILIPNEEFIIQRVASLTHSNTRGRAELLIGIHYDSDVELAQRLAIEAAKAQPRILMDPEPVCFVLGFGASSVDLGLYFWVPDIQDGTLGTKSEVLLKILHSFRENGITIPYPHQVTVPYEDSGATPPKAPKGKKA